MKKLITYYAFVISTIMALMGFIGAQTLAQLASAILFFPMAVYFWLLVLPNRKSAIVFPKVSKAKSKKKEKVELAKAKMKKLKAKEGEDSTETYLAKKIVKLKRETEEGTVEDERQQKLDQNRRMFVKLIGSAGVTVFLFSIFTKRAQGAFFGSVPGPGVVALKDTTGTQIDPAIKQPTDGYRIAELDDSSPAYYGFVNKDGDWFIMRESSDGEYKYYKKTALDSDFETEWANRASFTYEYFDSIF